MGLFRKRDFAVAVLIAIAIYLSYFETPGLTYSVDPAWFIEQTTEPDSQANRRVDYKLLPPIITDLEGDGVNEVILITCDLKLKVGFHYNCSTGPVITVLPSRFSSPICTGL
jgi:hypothetical protein